VQETYEGRFGGESQEVNLSKYPKAKPADNNTLIEPMTQQEIQKAYSRAKKDSASGPDGIGLKKLKELDPQFAMTSNLYNVWLYREYRFCTLLYSSCLFFFLPDGFSVDLAGPLGFALMGFEQADLMIVISLSCRPSMSLPWRGVAGD
jgi:hypothetical protein